MPLEAVGAVTEVEPIEQREPAEDCDNLLPHADLRNAFARVSAEEFTNDELFIMFKIFTILDLRFTIEEVLL